MLPTPILTCCYLRVSGQQPKTTTDDAADLVAATADGRLTIRDVATALKTWTH